MKGLVLIAIIVGLVFWRKFSKKTKNMKSLFYTAEKVYAVRQRIYIKENEPLSGVYAYVFLNTSNGCSYFVRSKATSSEALAIAISFTGTNYTIVENNMFYGLKLHITSDDKVGMIIEDNKIFDCNNKKCCYIIDGNSVYFNKQNTPYCMFEEIDKEYANQVISGALAKKKKTVNPKYNTDSIVSTPVAERPVKNVIDLTPPINTNAVVLSPVDSNQVEEVNDVASSSVANGSESDEFVEQIEATEPNTEKEINYFDEGYKLLHNTDDINRFEKAAEMFLKGRSSDVTCWYGLAETNLQQAVFYMITGESDVNILRHLSLAYISINTCANAIKEDVWQSLKVKIYAFFGYNVFLQTTSEEGLSILQAINEGALKTSGTKEAYVEKSIELMLDSVPQLEPKPQNEILHQLNTRAIGTLAIAIFQQEYPNSDSRNKLARELFHKLIDFGYDTEEKEVAPFLYKMYKLGIGGEADDQKASYYQKLL